MIKNPCNIELDWKYWIVDDVIDSSTSDFVNDKFKNAPLHLFDNKQVYGIEYQIPVWDFDYLVDLFDRIINQSEISSHRKKQRTWLPRLGNAIDIPPPNKYVEVQWKHNRGLFFCSTNHRTWHAYKNTTDRYRYTVGIHLYDINSIVDNRTQSQYNKWKLLRVSKDNFWYTGGPNTLKELNSWM